MNRDNQENMDQATRDNPAFNICRHCRKALCDGMRAVRLSSWWLICVDCMREARVATLRKYKGQIALEYDREQ